MTFAELCNLWNYNRYSLSGLTKGLPMDVIQKKCPLCAQMIPAEALVCPVCRRDVDTREGAAAFIAAEQLRLKAEKRRKANRKLIGYGLLGALIVLIISNRDDRAPESGGTTPTQTLPPAKPPAPRPLTASEAAGNMSISTDSWRKKFSVMTADFSLNNGNSFDVKDVEIRCDHTAPSGTRIDSNTRTIYEVFRANAARQLKDFNMGFIHEQAAETSCRVVSVVPIR
jgi:hypothetical protein